jgi:hypothetical protein
LDVATKVPVALADAKTCDTVIMILGGSPRLAEVTADGPKRLRVGRKWYERAGGNCTAARILGVSRGRLADPTPQLIARIAELDREREAAERRRVELDADRRINRRIAADWLVAQTDPSVIEETLYNQTLDEVFDTLQKAGIV